MPARPSLSDIARALGVSVAAVSNALSGKGRISDDLAATIRSKAEEMGYVPSPAGRALRTGRSRVLGLVLADMAHPLFPQISQAIEHAASDQGYGVLIGDSRGDIAAQTRAINRLIERGVDGLIIVPRHGTRIADVRRPVVMIDTPSTPGNTVSADHWDGGEQIGVHLTDLGHRHIVVIGGYPDSNVQSDRLGGLKSAARGKAVVETIWISDRERANGSGCALGLITHMQRGATAFAALSDLHALRAITELQGAGIAVPREATVTGFDDLIWSTNISPALTTMRMNVQQIAEIAVMELERQIEAQFDGNVVGAPPDEGQSVPMTLIVRQSSGQAPARDVEFEATNQSNNTQTERV